MTLQYMNVHAPHVLLTSNLRCSVVFCPPLPTWNANFNSTSNDFNVTVEYWCKSGDAFTDSEGDETLRKTSTCVEDKTWQEPIVECVRKYSLYTSV